MFNILNEYNNIFSVKEETRTRGHGLNEQRSSEDKLLENYQSHKEIQ